MFGQLEKGKGQIEPRFGIATIIDVQGGPPQGALDLWG